MKTFLIVFSVFLAFLAGEVWAAESQLFPITLTAKDSRSALKMAEEEALKQAITKFLSYSEQLTYASAIKKDIIDKIDIFISEANIVNENEENGAKKYNININIKIDDLQKTINNFKINNPTETNPGVVKQVDSKTSNEKARINTHQALNYALIAVSQILYSRDKILITQIYDDIINNINFAEIKDDQELIDLYKRIMDRITEMRIDDEMRNRLAFIKDRKQENAVIKAASDNLPRNSGGGGLWGFIGAAVSSVAGGFIDYELNTAEYQAELDQGNWQLEDKSVREINDLNKQVLETSWRLLNRYSLDGEKRLSQQILGEFSRVLAAPDRAVALRQLIRLENEFSLYPPYWFYRGFLHQTQGQKKEALDCFKNFDKIWRPILIKDPMYAEVAKFLLVDSIERANKENQKKYADIIIKHSDKDSWLNIAFAGIVYDELGDRATAEDIFQRNIDNERGIPVSRLALSNLKQNKKASLGIQEFAELRLKYEESDDLDSLMKLADIGDADSLDKLVARYYLGIGVTKNLVKAYELGKKLADQGYPYSQWVLGCLYEEGQEVEKNWPEAVKWYRLAAAQGLARAQASLGFMYFEGQGVTQDKVEAVKWYRRAAEQGFSKAQGMMGLMYLEGKEVTKDVVEAVKWMNLAVEQDNAAAQYFLGTWYYDGIEGIAQDKTKGLRLLILSAEQGDDWAQNKLGEIYFTEPGSTKDLAEAVRWTRLAAEQGNVDSQTRLGRMLLFGFADGGVAKNETEAAKWMRLAADQGFAEAQYYLGVMFDDGLGVSQDKTAAVNWYRLSAEKNFASAQLLLGLAYVLGEGITEDEKEGIKWLRLAADQNNPIAQGMLGSIYRHGWGVPVDTAEAIKWYHLSASQNSPMAQYNLGEMYYQGEGVTQDKPEALKWFRLAAEQGDEDAQEALKKYDF
ncbi:MAG: hypothetical protein LBR11_07055 [Deltaproteobacteria bacterium]|nr:hypothetical protein [Deltaproteobacteria bacterium]